jgi:protein-glutamine gamma-glutamyltransferase
MKRAPLLFTLSLLFWGAQSGHWLLAGVSALWLEWAQRTTHQWALSDKDIERIVDLTSLAAIAVALYRYSGAPLAEAIFAILIWWPLLLLPLLSAQLLSGRQGIERRALYYTQRKRSDPAVRQGLDLTFPYAAGCLLAAGQQATAPLAYLPGLALILGWLLWWNRPRRARLALWLVLLGLATGLGYLGQLGLRQTQARLEDVAVEWLTRFFSGETDPYKTRTALGDLGNLKLSDRILFRAEGELPEGGLLLRTATYNRYLDATWFSHQQGFAALRPQGAGDVWQWGTGQLEPGGSQQVRIAVYLEQRQNILPVPTAAWRLEDLPVVDLARHPFGAIKAGEGPGLVRYLAHFDQAAAGDAPPEEADLRVPNTELAALELFASQLELNGLPPEQTAQRIKGHFQREFSYTLDLPGSKLGQTALAHFLLERRRGHCEYFATATVLLLRLAGIPARYAVGYAVREPGDRPHEYLVRKSHAHAWTLYWRDGRWWNLDTTPALWFELEAEAKPLWQPLLDWLSDLYYRYALSQLESVGGRHNPWLWGVLALLFLVLGYRLRPGRAGRRKGSGTVGQVLEERSPLGEVMAVFAHAGFARQPWETYGLWLGRLRRAPGLEGPCAGLEALRWLHYRHRYRPAGLSEPEQARMRQLADDWLARWGQGLSHDQSSPLAPPAQQKL